MRDIIRQNEKTLRETMKKMYRIVRLLIEENLNLELYFAGSKMGINEFIWEGLCAEGGGGVIRGVTQVLRKR